jgi:hypothetical protein
VKKTFSDVVLSSSKSPILGDILGSKFLGFSKKYRVGKERFLSSKLGERVKNSFLISPRIGDNF